MTVARTKLKYLLSSCLCGVHVIDARKISRPDRAFISSGIRGTLGRITPVNYYEVVASRDESSSAPKNIIFSSGNSFYPRYTRNDETPTAESNSEVQKIQKLLWHN